MKRIIFWLIILFLVVWGLKSCLHADINDVEIQAVPTIDNEQRITPPSPQKNVTIDGVDYLQSQTPVGKLGGTLVASTIGEGPKTFNPFNSRDNISSQMSDIMYDGLLTTNPYTGEVIPKLAKSFEVNGTEYLIKLRKGLKWSDGKPITADDVVFTWKDIVFAGIGNTSVRDSIVIDGKLPTVEKIDDYTVKFITPEPFAPFLRMLSNPIAPKHVFESAVKKGNAYFDTFLSTDIILLFIIFYFI